jgi:hypothetical protein
MSTFRDGFRFAMLSLCLLFVALASPAAAQQPLPRASVRCESEGSYVRCPAVGSWRGARLVQQLSRATCLQGRTWGFDRNAIWVNDGCRGVFDAGDPYANVGQRVTCASVSGGLTECPADTRYGVTLRRQLSTASCAEDRTWGTNDNGIWVDRGCRGEFEVGGGAGGGGQTTARLTCGSPTGLQVTCKTNGYATAVRLVRDQSGGRCQQGQNWGHTDSFIWANRGCRGEFEVTYRGGEGGGPGPGPGSQRVTCGASTLQRVTCATGGSITSARLMRDLSGSRCRQNVTWGYDAAALWIKDGCIGDFLLAVRGAGGPAGATRLILCGSSTGQQRQCQTEGEALSVRLVDDLSNGRCQERVNWGHTSTFIWTNRGCRGRFEVTYRPTATPYN